MNFVELPKPIGSVNWAHDGKDVLLPAYSADQMRAYANACLAAVAPEVGGYEARVVCDWTDPGGTGIILVEVEDAAGKSINVGPWHDRPDGYKELRLYATPPTGAKGVEVDDAMVERGCRAEWQPHLWDMAGYYSEASKDRKRARMRLALTAALTPQGDKGDGE